MTSSPRGAAQGTAGALREVTLTLHTPQVQDVIRQAMAPWALAEVLAPAEPEVVTSTLKPLLEDRACSRSVVRALIVLASFPADGSEHDLTAIATDIGLSPATTHRYLHTLTAAGLLVRDSNSRRYHRPQPASAR